MILTVINAELLSQENLQDEVVNAPGVKDDTGKAFFFISYLHLKSRGH